MTLPNTAPKLMPTMALPPEIQSRRDELQRDFIAAWQAFERAKTEAVQLFEAAGAAHAKLLEHKLQYDLPPTDQDATP